MFFKSLKEIHKRCILAFEEIMASSSSFPQTPNLLGKNYELQNLKKKTFLQAQECWDTLQITYVQPTQEAWVVMTNNQRNATIELRKKEHRAKCWIQNSVDDSIFEKITGAIIEKQCWNIFQAMYQGNDTVKTIKFQTLRAQFETLKMDDTDNVCQ